MKQITKIDTKIEKNLPAKDFGEGLDVAIDHLLFRGTFAAGLVHDDEPMLVIAAGEERRHLGGWAVAEVGPGVEWGVGGVTGTVDAASD